MFRPKYKTKFEIKQKNEDHSTFENLADVLKNNRPPLLLKRPTTSVPKRKLIVESLKGEDDQLLELKRKEVE